jgi:NTP pyrophosphatase (non-canonical NTP hydrolase)
MTKDKLNDIFEKRELFMRLIRDKIPETYPQWPVDLSQKQSQITCRETALKGVEEMFEALQHLKNWKPHRITDIPEIDREEFLEEIVDAFNYFFSLMILIGVDVNEFYDAFNKKDEIIKRRLEKGY